MDEEMDENNLQTPVVVQVASHEEENNRSLCKMEFDESESPKNYVIDQIFCGENLTIYALFEISELSGKKSEKHLLEVSESSTNEEFKFYHRSSYKKSIEDKQLNGFKSNCKNFTSDDIELLTSKDRIQMTESYYCFKNCDGQYEVSREVDDSSDLKVLYSKKPSMVKSKFVSKGVNTDIAQCPKLVDDVRKAIGNNKPFSKGDGKTIEIQPFPPVKSSYELIEMETAPSSSSCGSDLDENRRNYQKSSPNVLLVPLLMMDEGVINSFQNEDKNQLEIEEKILSSEKVSLGINTDFSCSEFFGGSKDSDRDQEPDFEQTRTKNPDPANGTGNICKKSNPNEENHETENESDLTSKKNILKEIKNLQEKLNILIQTLECSESSKDSKPKDSLGEKNPSIMELVQPSVEQTESKTESKPVKRNHRKYDDLPIFSPVTFNTTSTKSSKLRKKPSSAERENPKETLTMQAKSTMSMLTTSESSIFRPPFAWNGNVREIERLDKKQTYWTNFAKYSKTLPISKSECSLQFRLFTLNSKCPFVVGLSYDLGEEKSEGAKKMKYTSLKSDGIFKSKNNVRVHSNHENVLTNSITPFNCKMGDEIGKKIKQDILTVQQKITKDEGLLKVLEKAALVGDLKKTGKNDEEGDAKITYQTTFSIPSLAFTPKNEKIVVNYCNTSGDRTLKSEKTFKKITGQFREKTGSNIDVEPKVNGPMDKPTTPNKNDRKLNTDANVKKEIKNSSLNKSKIPDKINKNVKKEIPQSESVKPRSLPGNRPKSGGQSKIHVDKLIKKAPGSANEIASNKAQAKSEKEEKLSGKNDQHCIPRAIPKPQTEAQKRERREVTQPQNGNKERETIPSKTETFDLTQDQTIYPNYSPSTSQVKAKEYYPQRHDFEEKIVPEDKPPVTDVLTDSSSAEGASPGLPSVLVELFSKKQSAIVDSHTEFDQDFTTGPDTDTSHVGLNESDVIVDAEDTNKLSGEGVKSVWALTKVLLYGDGTKKFEVLEVSLTPPDCSLNNEKMNDLKNG